MCLEKRRGLGSVEGVMLQRAKKDVYHHGMFTKLVEVMISMIHTHVSSHQIAQLKYVQFMPTIL